MSPAVNSTKKVSFATGQEILIVEDTPPVARAMAKLLSSNGMRPTVCSSATQALMHIEHQKPAAAVIDIHLPDLSGLILSQQLRSRLGPRTPIIVVSGDGSQEVLNSLAQVGATYFFSKPVNARALVEKLQGLLQ